MSYLGHVDIVLDGAVVRAFRVPVDYEALVNEVVFFGFDGNMFKVSFDSLNIGEGSLQALSGFDGSIDTALPQDVFNELLDVGDDPRRYVWWYGPDSGLFGELLLIDIMKRAAARRLSRLINASLT